jgi:hypothetical protein
MGVSHFNFMKNPWLFALMTLVLGVLGGLVTGLNIRSDEAKGGSPSEERGAGSAKANSGSRQVSATERDTKRAKRPMSIGQISGMPGSTQRVQAMLDFYADLSPSQFEREAGKLDQLPMNERMLASFLLFGRWAELDPTAAMEFSGSMGFGGMFVKPTILQGWASVDPAGAAAYLAENPREFSMMGAGGRAGGRDGVSIIGAEWARQNPAAAMAWASTLGEGRAEAIGAVVGEVAKLDPAKASKMLSGMTGEDFTEAFQSVARSYGAKNFEEAQAWIASLPANQRDDALAAAIGGLSSDDEARAAAAQVKLMAQGSAKNRAVAEVVGDIAREDPKYAAEFLMEQGSDAAKRLSMRELISSWVSKDAPNALAYTYGLEAGDLRDSALQSYVMSNTATDPSQVILVAENIQDEGERIRSLSIAATRWMQEDAAAATAYVEQSQLLTDADKSRILNGRGWFGGRFGGDRGERRNRTR